MSLISAAHAATTSGAAGQHQQGGASSFIILIAVFLVIYFLMLWPQRRRSKQQKELLNSLQKGDEVITNGGLLGKISDLDENVLTVEISENVFVKVQRGAVSATLPKGTVKAA